jgi:hypothetical protein
MKRHADQLKTDQINSERLRTHRVTELNAPYVAFPELAPGYFGAVLAVKRSGGEQCNYAMRVDLSELRAMGIEPMSREREFHPNWWKHEEEQRAKRQHAIEYFAHQIAAGMLDFLEREDPKFGYSDEEWRKMKL